MRSAAVLAAHIASALPACHTLRVIARRRDMKVGPHCICGTIDASLPLVSIQAGLAVSEKKEIRDDGERVTESVDALFADVYQRLKAMAGSQLARNRGPGSTLDTTALVHDVYLRMNAQSELTFERKAHFFAYAARVMRHLLTDYARTRLSMRAGGDWVRVTLTGENKELMLESAEHTLALDEAISRLEATDARAARVLELRYFAGLTIEQIAESLILAPRTVDRDSAFRLRVPAFGNGLSKVVSKSPQSLRDLFDAVLDQPQHVREHDLLKTSAPIRKHARKSGKCSLSIHAILRRWKKARQILPAR